MFAWRPSGGMAVGWRPWLDGPTLQFLQVRRVQRTLSVAVRAMGGPGACVHGHMADTVAAADAIKGHLRSSGTTRWFREQRSVKPSAQPTLVRTQHLPPPAKTARSLRKRGPAGRFLLVPPCVIVCRCRAWRSKRYGHIADSVRAEGAVRGTACFTDPCPFVPLRGYPDCSSDWSMPCIPVGRVLGRSVRDGRRAGLVRIFGRAGCRIGSRRPVEAAAEAVTGCASSAAGRKTGTVPWRATQRAGLGRHASGSVMSQGGPPVSPLRDWIRLSRSCTCRGPAVYLRW